MIFHEQQHQTPFLTIRPCREEEVSLVATLAFQWEREQITTGFRADDPEVLRTKLGPFFLLALRDDEVIGFVIASQQEAVPGEMAVFLSGGRYLEIDDLYLSPPSRNQGIGTALMKAVMQTANQQAIVHFSVYSSTKDWRRIASFYEKLGFKMWFVRMFQ
jgi:GNAT superfamily N-acetyltransferase